RLGRRAAPSAVRRGRAAVTRQADRTAQRLAQEAPGESERAQRARRDRAARGGARLDWEAVGGRLAEAPGPARETRAAPTPPPIAPLFGRTSTTSSLQRRSATQVPRTCSVRRSSRASVARSPSRRESPTRLSPTRPRSSNSRWRSAWRY